jgi:hypothetical protein
MARQLARAVSYFLEGCPSVVAVHDLATKVRIELIDGYLLDLYFNATLGKYTYALIREGQSVRVWDNAPHHPEQTNYPHHCHTEDGSIEPSSLVGDPEQDIVLVTAAVNARFQS